MANVVVVGAQWGDEGKGKIVDWLSERADVIARFQGGHNAGHTLVIDGKVYKLNALPSGVVLGLADLGTAPAPVKQCEKDTWAHDHDNYLDVCLDMSWYKLPPAQVHVLCGEATQISAPKGVRYPCKPHTVNVTRSQ